jgi:hypothetical protein
MSKFTQAQLDALKAAYAAGIRSVTHGENSVTYASMKDMAEAIAQMERALSGRRRVHYPAFERGT